MAIDNTMTPADDYVKLDSTEGPWTMQQEQLQFGNSNSGRPTIKNMRIDAARHMSDDRPCPCEGGFVYR